MPSSSPSPELWHEPPLPSLLQRLLRQWSEILVMWIWIPGPLCGPLNTAPLQNRDFYNNEGEIPSGGGSKPGGSLRSFLLLRQISLSAAPIYRSLLPHSSPPSPWNPLPNLSPRSLLIRNPHHLLALRSNPSRQRPHPLRLRHLLNLCGQPFRTESDPDRVAELFQSATALLRFHAQRPLFFLAIRKAVDQKPASETLEDLPDLCQSLEPPPHQITLSIAVSARPSTPPRRLLCARPLRL